MRRGRGWHRHSYEHALAARGVEIKRTGKFLLSPSPWKRTINVKFWHGLVEGVAGLPKGWSYEIEDLDLVAVGEAKRKGAFKPKVMRIVVKGGVLWDSKNLPKGIKYVNEEHEDVE